MIKGAQDDIFPTPTCCNSTWHEDAAETAKKEREQSIWCSITCTGSYGQLRELCRRFLKNWNCLHRGDGWPRRSFIKGSDLVTDLYLLDLLASPISHQNRSCFDKAAFRDANISLKGSDR